MSAPVLNWKRLQPGWYEARDEQGTLWRIVQRTSCAWEVIEIGVGVDHEQSSLADAKNIVVMIVRERVDPEYRARREAARARRRALRRAKAGTS
jgi:hypothetical protein